MKIIPQISPKFGIEEAEALKDYILSGGWGTENKYTLTFEKLVADYLNIEHCSAVNNGTIGLILALMALGIGKGNKVVVPALTMIATANAVRFVGAEPVFVDIEPDTLCLDIEKTLSTKADAVIYVSLNGRCGDIEALKGIPLIEDACQSLGSEYKERKLGTFGDIGVFSLSPHKIISTGQGGLVVTKDNYLYERIEKLKDFGRLTGGGDYHPEFGINAKFTDFQAVIGIEQLKTLEWRIKRKKEIFRLYTQLLKDTLAHPSTPWMVDYYGVKKDYSFQTRPMYGVIPHQPVYADYTKYPVSEEISYKGLWLPSSVTLTDEQIIKICEEING